MLAMVSPRIHGRSFTLTEVCLEKGEYTCAFFEQVEVDGPEGMVEGWWKRGAAKVSRALTCGCGSGVPKTSRFQEVRSENNRYSPTFYQTHSTACSPWPFT